MLWRNNNNDLEKNLSYYTINLCIYSTISTKQKLKYYYKHV